jgi:MFS family permease
MPASTVLRKRPLSFLLEMPMLMLGANFVWVSYNTILLLPLVQRVVPLERASLTVGVIGFLSTLVGLTVSMLSGILSDHSSSRLGRRTPGILLGALLGLPVIASAGVLRLSLPVICLSYVGMQVCTNIANGSWWPLLVDAVPENQRGLAAGLNGFYTLLAAALGFLAITYLNETGRPGLALVAMGTVFALSGVVCALAIRHYDKPAADVGSFSLRQAFADIFRVRTVVGVFFWVVLASFWANMGINSMQYFARDFMRVFLALPNPDAGLRVMGLIQLVITMLSAVVCGVLSDRIGRRKLILLGAFGSAAGTLAMALSRNYTVFLAVAALRSAATGPIVAVIPALTSGLAPSDEAGHYMAYANVATGLSGAVSSLLFGAILNLRGEATPASFVTLLVVAAAFFVLGGAVIAARVPQRPGIEMPG